MLKIAASLIMALGGSHVALAGDAYQFVHTEQYRVPGIFKENAVIVGGFLLGPASSFAECEGRIYWGDRSSEATEVAAFCKPLKVEGGLETAESTSFPAFMDLNEVEERLARQSFWQLDGKSGDLRLCVLMPSDVVKCAKAQQGSFPPLTERF